MRSNYLNSPVAEEFLGIERAEMKSSSLNCATMRRIHQRKIEWIMFESINEDGEVSLKYIHQESEELGLQSKKLIGAIVTKLKRKEYVESKEGEEGDIIYKKGRRFIDWKIALSESASAL